MSKKLINTPESCVDDAIHGILSLYPHIVRIGALNILVRKDIESYKQSHVTLISGGGSGHEPAHAGYIGDGMLSGAVLGNVFASPSVSSILAAIRMCAGPHGVLVIVKNYTGDRLNFGMAIERAKTEGIAAKMVIVDDDCALPVGKGITGGRGVAGTCLVHKIAGAFAHEQGCRTTLDEVHNVAMKTVVNLGTLGVALSVCTVPGGQVSTRLNDVNTVEVGMGIHGEPGKEQLLLNDFLAKGTVASSVIDILVSGIIGVQSVTQQTDNTARLQLKFTNSQNPHASNDSNDSRRDPSSYCKVALLLNNLGGLSVLELLICAKEVIFHFHARGISIAHIFVGSYMTALNMNGISLSVLRLEDSYDTAVDHDLYRLLVSPTTAPAWIPGTVPRPVNTTEYSIEVPTMRVVSTISTIVEPSSLSDENRDFSLWICQLLSKICDALIALEDQLTYCDSICGDGDCGIVLKAGAYAIRNKLYLPCTTEDQNNSSSCSTDELLRLWSSPALVCSTLADTISASMGGTLGAILEILLRAMETSFQKESNVSDSLITALAAIQLYGGASVGMRTMLDAFAPAVVALQHKGVSKETLVDAAIEAERGANSTKLLTALAGRSNYISSESMNGVPDPGALAVAQVFRTIADHYTSISI